MLHNENLDSSKVGAAINFQRFKDSVCNKSRGKQEVNILFIVCSQLLVN